MIVANPIYDTAFKRLMENTRIAKGLLSRILGEEIVSLEFRPQEFTDKKDMSITLFRVDFSAVILTSGGERKNVLIEVQKAKLVTDLVRFRNYLGSHYKKTEDNGNGVGEPIPIVTVYFLNFCLNEAFPKVIQVAREYRDAVSGEKVDGKHEFIETLTHDSYWIQIPLLDSDTSSDLERALSVFDQHYVIKGDKHRLLLEGVSEQDDELVKEMARELERAAADTGLDPYFDLEDEMLYGQRKHKQMYEEAVAEKEEAVAEKKALLEKLKEAGIDPESL